MGSTKALFSKESHRSLNSVERIAVAKADLLVIVHTKKIWCKAMDGVVRR